MLSGDYNLYPTTKVSVSCTAVMIHLLKAKVILSFFKVHPAPLTRTIYMSRNDTILQGCCDANNNLIAGETTCLRNILLLCGRWLTGPMLGFQLRLARKSAKSGLR